MTHQRYTHCAIAACFILLAPIAIPFVLMFDLLDRLFAPIDYRLHATRLYLESIFWRHTE